MKLILICAVVCASMRLSMVNRYLLIIWFHVIFLTKLQTAPADDLDALVNGVFTECKVKEGASDADLAEVVARKAPSTIGSKCIYACSQEAHGMVKDGKLMVADTIEIFSKGFDDKKIIAAWSDVVTGCGGITDADRCQRADKIFHCLTDNMAARGFNLLL